MIIIQCGNLTVVRPVTFSEVLAERRLRAGTLCAPTDKFGVIGRCVGRIGWLWRSQPSPCVRTRWINDLHPNALVRCSLLLGRTSVERASEQKPHQNHQFASVLWNPWLAGALCRDAGELHGTG